MVELCAAPPAPICYTTDGSDPKLSGGSYDGPFVVPSGTHFVLAVAEHDGIASEVHKREITWKKDEGEKPIDKESPATWRPAHGFSFSTTRSSYSFVERLRKYNGKAGVQRIAVLDTQWVDLNLADGLTLDAERIEHTVEHLRSLVAHGEVNIDAGFICFPSGQQLLDYVQDLRVELKRNEVEQ